MLDFSRNVWVSDVFVGVPEGQEGQADVMGWLVWDKDANHWEICLRHRTYRDGKVFGSEDVKEWRLLTSPVSRNQHQSVRDDLIRLVNGLKLTDLEIYRLLSDSEDATKKFTALTSNSKYFHMKTMSKEEAQREGYLQKES